MLGTDTHACNPSIGRDRGMLRAHWLASLAKVRDFQLSKRACLRKYGREQQKEMPGSLLRPPHGYT